MPNEFQASRKGRPLADSVNVFIDGGTGFSGWETISVTEQMDSIANTFNLTLDKKQADGLLTLKRPFPLKPGVRVDINLGRDPVLRGRIDTMNMGFSDGNRTLSISGRSFPGDLVDCSVTGQMEYTNIRLDKLAEALIEPFELRVFLSVEPKVIAKFGVKPGETVFTALDRAARLQGFLWISTREGNIRLTQAGKFRAVTELHQNENIKAATMSFDDSDRFRDYKVIGSTAGSDDFGGTNASQPAGSAFDLGITRFRPKTIIAEASVDTEKAKTRAGWEASVRITQAMELSCQVQGWRQSDGETLWGSNQVTFFKSDIFNLKQDMLISRVTRTKSIAGGTTCQLTLVRPDSFQSKPIFKKEDDPTDLWG